MVPLRRRVHSAPRQQVKWDLRSGDFRRVPTDRVIGTTKRAVPLADGVGEPRSYSARLGLVRRLARHRINRMRIGPSAESDAAIRQYAPPTPSTVHGGTRRRVSPGRRRTRCRSRRTLGNRVPRLLIVPRDAPPRPIMAEPSTTIDAADGDLEHGLIETAGVRIDAGRERLAEAAITLAHRALDEGLALHRCGPRDTETTPCGDLAPLGLLGAALETVRTTSSSNAAAAGAALEHLRAHLESHRRDGLWSSARGCIPTSTNTALVALAGLAPDHSTLETLRGPSGGLVPQAVTDDGGGDAMRRTSATEHWEQEDVPTTALVEASRMDAGLDPVVDAAWFLKRFRKWGGLSFTPSTMGLWAIARFTSRLGARAADVESDAEAPSDDRTRELRATVIRMIHSARRAPGHANEVDPVLHESLGILTL